MYSNKNKKMYKIYNHNRIWTQKLQNFVTPSLLFTYNLQNVQY